VPVGVDEESIGNADTFVLGSKAAYAAETYLLGLFQLYPTVYFHKATRGAERLFSELLFRVIQLVQDGSGSKTGLSELHPLTAFARAPEELDCVLNLDDTAVWGALAEMTQAEDQVVESLAIRLRDRHLYKCIDVREEIACQLGNKVDPKIVDEACTVANDIVMSFAETQDPNSLAKVLVDVTEREPYKQLQESKGALNQIMIKRPDGSLVDVAEISQVVAAVKTFKLFRVYVSSDDDPTKNVIADAIREGLNHARKSA
jgi:HD superfamily phosphohydrolase